MKDLVNAPIQKYDNMYNIIGNSQSSSLSSFTSSSTIGDSSSFLPSASSSSSSTIGDSSSFLPSSSIGDSSSFLPSASSSSSSIGDSSSFLMKNELKHFLKTQLKR
jgi:hypothetical protein